MKTAEFLRRVLRIDPIRRFPASVHCHRKRSEGADMSFTEKHLYFDDVAVGQQWESTGRTVTETDVVNFAGVSGDFNAIHMDHHFCAQTPFRKPIAHGLLVFSIASGLTQYFPPMRTMAFLEIREWHFRAPVFFGDTIRGRATVLSKELRGRGRRGAVVWQRQILNQENKVVQEGQIVTLVECRPAAGAQPAADGGEAAS
jgi:acyl dehydratase